jgi:hypothetical protein
MTASTPVRRLRRCRAVAAPAAVLVLLALAGTASGRAEVGTFHFQEPFSDTITDYPCFEGVVGTITGTETIDGRFTENGPPAFGFHGSGSSAVNYRVDFADGRYVVGVGSARFNFNATARQHITDTNTGRDRATVYAANGQPIGPLTTHATYHVTYIDADANNEPEPGELTTSVDRLRDRCP